MSQEKQFDKRGAEPVRDVTLEKLNALHAIFRDNSRSDYHKAIEEFSRRVAISWENIAARCALAPESAPSHAPRSAAELRAEHDRYHDSGMCYGDSHAQLTQAIKRAEEAESVPSTTPQKSGSATPRMDATLGKGADWVFAEGCKLERELAVSFKRFDDLQAHYSNELTKLEGASAASAIAPNFPNVCDGQEQDAFERWASVAGMDMNQHPLHWLFLDAKTYAAREGWKAAIQYVRKAAKVDAANNSPDGGNDRG